MLMLPKNLNVYWTGVTTLAAWFLFVHSPPILIKRHLLQDLPFAFHLIGAYTIYLACIFNTMLTPSTLDGKAKPWHVAVGRIEMIAGILSFLFGAVCSWWPTRDLPPTGFAIGITIGGSFQVFYQVMGYIAIKKYQRLKQRVIEMEASSGDGIEAEAASLEQLKKDRDEALVEHILSMVALFAVGCSAPAMIRFGSSLGLSMNASLVVGLLLLIAIIRPYANIYIRRLKPTTAEEAPLLTE